MSQAGLTILVPLTALAQELSPALKPTSKASWVRCLGSHLGGVDIFSCDSQAQRLDNTVTVVTYICVYTVL